ncbi:unnamed protein product [Discosporangium mesarthrocarpum]
MYSLQANIIPTTMRPWRPLYAYACCCYLLPLSLSLHPLGHATTATAPRRSLHSPHSGRRVSSLVTAAGLQRGVASQRVSDSLSSRCHYLVGFLGHPVLEARALSTSSRWSTQRKGQRRRARGLDITMGKGTERKRSKKYQARRGTVGGGMGGGRVGVVKGQPKQAAAVHVPLHIEDLSTEEEFREAFKHYEKASSPRRVQEAVSVAGTKGVGNLMHLTATAVCSVLRLSRADIARAMISTVDSEEWRSWLRKEPSEATSVVRGACLSPHYRY